jgi:hypothetical protein
MQKKQTEVVRPNPKNNILLQNNAENEATDAKPGFFKGLMSKLSQSSKSKVKVPII